VANAEADQKPPPDQGSNSSESPLPQQQPQQTEKDAGRRRKRKRELKSKTYMNDEGFMGECISLIYRDFREVFFLCLSAIMVGLIMINCGII